MKTKTDKHFNRELFTSLGYVRIVANENAVTEIRFFEDSIYVSEPQIGENKVSKEAKKQLSEYLDNTRTDFDLPLAPKGTEFQQKVWQALCNIEYG